jgi:hypothetical protein
LVVGLLALFAQPAAASPGPYQVLFVNGIGPGGCSGDNGVQNQMATLPGVVKVDGFDASVGTPTVAQLAPYDEAVVHADCDSFDDPETLGNNLADYVDHGGVVVQYAFTMQNSGSFTPGGRWQSGGYSPFLLGDNADNDVTLGEHDTSSPLMAGVNTLTSTGCNVDSGLAPGATRLAQWNNGMEAIATKGQVLGVTSSIDESDCGWSGDYAQLTWNALKLQKVPGGTMISMKKIIRKKRKAQFAFSASSGHISGFECALTRAKPKKKGKKSKAASFSSCSSPKTYKKLKPGKYTFQVRATNGAGPDPAPAVKKFKI